MYILIWFSGKVPNAKLRDDLRVMSVGFPLHFNFTYYTFKICVLTSLSLLKKWIDLTWLAVVGVTALLSGVLARAKAVASSLCVIGRGPVAPLWLRDTGRAPAEAPALLEGPAWLPCHTQIRNTNLTMANSFVKFQCLMLQADWLTDWNSSSSSDMPSNMNPPVGIKEK